MSDPPKVLFPNDTHPVDGDVAGGGEQLARLCGNVLRTASLPPQRPAWVLPLVVTLRHFALGYQAARRRGEAPGIAGVARQVLEATAAKMHRWPVASEVPAWVTVERVGQWVARLGVDSGLSEAKLIEWLSRAPADEDCNFPGID